MPYKNILERAGDRVMSMAELMEDNSFKKIPRNKIEYFIDESINIGNETANNFLNKYSSIEGICEHKKIEIKIETEEYDFETVRLRGEYKEGKEKIIMYKRSMKRMEEAYKKLGMDFLNYDNIYKILLAHELFHYIESKEIGKIYEKLEQIYVIKLGPLKRLFPIQKTSDIGANVFVKHALDLSFNPKILNYLYFWGSGLVDKNRILNYLDELDENLMYLS